MVDVSYSRQLLVDFNKLIQDFSYFTAFNLIHADKGPPGAPLSPEHQAKMLELIRYSNDNNRILSDLFLQPLIPNEVKNKEKLIKNFSSIMEFLHNYLNYAGAILSACRPDIHTERFTQLQQHYASFCQKYLASS